jgi:Holliday junction resolvase RusA-like endonuclease
MTKISFTVLGKPRGKGRPRFFRGHAYTPPETRDYEKRVKQCYLMETGGHCFSGPVAVTVEAYFSIPKSWSKAKKAQAMKGEVMPGKPDIDNIIKIVLDALNGVAYDDDSHVIAISGRKSYTIEETSEGVYIRITSVEGENWDGCAENASKSIWRDNES